MSSRSQPPHTSTATMLSPDTISHIFSYLDKASLATCLRVSHRFYDIAATPLYRHLSIQDEMLGSILVGVDVITKERATRRTPAQRNLKSALLARTHTIAVFVHAEDHHFRQITRYKPFPNLHTLRIAPTSTCESATKTRFCPYGPGNCFLIESLQSHARLDKLVLNVHQNFASLSSLANLLARGVRCLTLIFESQMSVLEIGNRPELLPLLRNQESLRLIFAPKNYLSNRVPNYHSYGVSVPPPTRSALINFLTDICLARAETTEIYLFFGFAIFIETSDERRGERNWGDISGIQEDVKNRFKAQDTRGRDPEDVIRMRSLGDYLREGVTDEIDQYHLTILSKAEAKRVDEEIMMDMDLMRECFWREQRDMDLTAKDYQNELSMKLELHHDEALRDVEMLDDDQRMWDDVIQLMDIVAVMDGMDLDDTIKGWERDTRRRLFMEVEKEYLCLQVAWDAGY